MLGTADAVSLSSSTPQIPLNSINNLLRMSEEEFVHNPISSPQIMRLLTTFFPFKFLEKHIKEVNVVERNGKTQMPALV